MSLAHIRGAQPSKSNRQPKTQNVIPRLTGLQKNIHKIVNAKKKNNLNSPSFGVNNIMDNKCFQFFMEYCTNLQAITTQIPINTHECNNFFNKHNIVFINERTQEISNAKALISTKTNRKRNNATFVIQIPNDYTDMLVFLILIKIDFGGIQIEFAPKVGKNIERFMFKAKKSGFRFYYDFIRLNIINKRFIIVR